MKIYHPSILKKKIHLYKFPNIKRFMLFSLGSLSLYYLAKKTQVIDKITNNLLDDIQNSNEIVSNGEDFINSIITNEKTQKSVENFIGSIANNVKFKTSINKFISTFLEKISSDKKLMSLLQDSILEIVTSSEVKEHSDKLIQFIGESQLPDKVSKFFKDLFTSDDVLTKLADLFEKSAMIAGEDEKIQNKLPIFIEEILSEGNLKDFLVQKSYDLVSMYTEDKKYYTFDDIVQEANKKVIDTINEL